MARCELCGKKKVVGRSGRHRRGVAGGQWIKRAPKTIKVFKPNLHKYQGKVYCTKCLRKVKKGEKETSKTAEVKPAVV